MALRVGVSVVEVIRSLHLCFIRSATLSRFPSWVIFIPARLAVLGRGRGRRRKQLGSFCRQSGGISDLLLGRVLDFNSCFLIAENEGIYERL